MNEMNYPAFKTVFDQYYQALCFFANKMIGDWSAAEDIVENVFIKLWNKQPDFSVFKNVKALLYISVRNACLDQIKMHRKKLMNQDAFSYLSKNESEDFILNEIIRAEVIREVYEEMKKLPPECKKVMQLYFVEGLDHKDIAMRLGVAASTVRNQKTYGTKILRKKFGNNFFLLLMYSAPMVMSQH